MSERVLVVDHRDSFAFLLGEQFARVGARVETVRCDVPLAAFRAFATTFDPHLVVLSPGPGGPADTGVTLPWLATDPTVPVLGVCLGHQALAFAAGGFVTRAPRPVHGRASPIAFEPDVDLPGNPLADACRAFVDRPFPAARYHSLVVARVGERQRALATGGDTDAPLVMALGAIDRPRLGLQFHPESVLTPHGGRLVQRVLECACAAHSTSTGNE
jgi:anthranilate synthase component 2